jgi:hypothetical protein
VSRARSFVEDSQGLAEAIYYQARNAATPGTVWHDRRRAVELQQEARIAGIAARAAYRAWLEVKR